MMWILMVHGPTASLIYINVLQLNFKPYKVRTTN